MKEQIMVDINDYGVTVEEYLDSLAEGIDLLELRRLESCGIPTDLALECISIHERIVNKTATPEEIVRGLMILTPSLRPQLIDSQQENE
jgi:hypothetical protein